jgi:5-methylcytosine-specific restriction protein A
MPSYACLVCGQVSNNRHCTEHAARIAEIYKDKERARGSASARGYDSTWRKTRAKILTANPICRQNDCDRIATEVHHLDGLGPNGPDGHAAFNLEALCKTHHSQITRADQLDTSLR